MKQHHPDANGARTAPGTSLIEIIQGPQLLTKTVVRGSGKALRDCPRPCQCSSRSGQREAELRWDGARASTSLAASDIQENVAMAGTKGRKAMRAEGALPQAIKRITSSAACLIRLPARYRRNSARPADLQSLLTIVTGTEPSCVTQPVARARGLKANICVRIRAHLSLFLGVSTSRRLRSKALKHRSLVRALLTSVVLATGVVLAGCNGETCRSPATRRPTSPFLPSSSPR